ncbi:MAG: hypothetical protein NC402_02435 [Prevotella sp.]|nr:hypothetical protein [Prevotella sp.]MCM1074659.1 hypothetical protein [Ruminococcus sp.]
MKKHFHLNLLIWALAMPFLFTACNDEDNYPNVYFNFDERGGVQHDGALYIQNGDSICMDRINVAVDKSTPTSLITACGYYWDGNFVGPGFAPDFGRKFFVYNQPLGRHVLSVKMQVAAEGYSLATYITNFPVIIVPESADINSINTDGTDLFSLRQ